MTRDPHPLVACVDFYASYALPVASNGFVRRCGAYERVLSVVNVDTGPGGQVVEASECGHVDIK